MYNILILWLVFFLFIEHSKRLHIMLSYHTPCNRPNAIKNDMNIIYNFITNIFTNTWNSSIILFFVQSLLFNKKITMASNLWLFRKIMKQLNLHDMINLKSVSVCSNYLKLIRSISNCSLFWTFIKLKNKCGLTLKTCWIS